MTFKTAAAVLLALIIVVSAEAEQNNINYRAVPEFIQNNWKIVLSINPKGQVEAATGSLIIGNSLVMISSKESNLSGDYSKLEISRADQYNFVEKESDTGYITVFQLSSKKGDVVLYPVGDFWRVCIRFENAGPYSMYSAILLGDQVGLKQSELYDSFLEIEKKLLQKTYNKSAHKRELCA